MGLFSVLKDMVNTPAPPFATTDWVVVDSNALGTCYAAIKRADTTGEFVKMWDMFDFNAPQSGGAGTYLSYKRLSEYDCTRRQVRRLAQYTYIGNMGKVGFAARDNSIQQWQPPSSGGIGQTLFQIADSLR